MNIKKINLKNLSEDETIHIVDVGQPKTSDWKDHKLTKLDEILKNKSKQFKFSNGLIMGSIDFEVDNLFSLNYHFKLTPNFDQFLESVKHFLATVDGSLSNSDIKNLQSQYESHIRDIVKDKDIDVIVDILIGNNN